MQGATRFNPRRWLVNASPRTFLRATRLFPPLRHCGVKIDAISDDWLVWDMRLPLRLKTRNFVGTHWGGTLYSALDSQVMLAWLQILGPDYVVWDKAASIRFRKPGRGTLRARLSIPAVDVAAVKAACAEGKHDRKYTMDWYDASGDVVATVEKTVHFQRAHAE